MIDYSFFYKFTVRSIIAYKFFTIGNTYNIPFISKLLLFFSLANIEDIHIVSAYNYAYLFRFFFGRKACFSRFKSFFSLGKWTYSLSIYYSVNDSSLYNELFFLSNDFLPKGENNYIGFGTYSSSLKVFYIVLKDLAFFSDRKTNLGLFFLQNNLVFHLTIPNVTNFNLFLSNMKLYLY